jgi:hypothetical protein
MISFNVSCKYNKDEKNEENNKAVEYCFVVYGKPRELKVGCTGAVGVFNDQQQSEQAKDIKQLNDKVPGNNENQFFQPGVWESKDQCGVYVHQGDAQAGYPEKKIHVYLLKMNEILSCSGAVAKLMRNPGK